MAKTKQKTHLLALRGKSVEELRDLAATFLPEKDSQSFSAVELRELLSAAASELPSLSRQLSAAPISIKPGFYVMSVATKAGSISLPTNLVEKIKAACGALNAEIDDESSEPTHKGFNLLGAQKLEGGVLEARFTWEQIFRYWAPDVTLKSIYILGIGFVLVDTTASKALVCCHSRPERQLLTELVSKATGLSFAPINLTKPLLRLIGEFEKLKRAAYFAAKKTSNQAANVAYADENLATIPSIRAQEESHDFERKQSFYKVELLGMTETGVGATSDSGKLWIPTEIPIDTVRDYGVALLKKISGTLRRMTGENQLSAWFNVLSIENVPSLAEVRPMELRYDIGRLVKELMYMVTGKQSERPFSLPMSFVTHGVPQFFDYSRLRLTDEDSGTVAYWSNPERTSQLIQCRVRNDRLELEGIPGDTPVNLRSLTHPLTNSELTIDDPLAVLEVRPTPRLHAILMDVFAFMVGEKPELKRLKALPFTLGSGAIHFNLDLALSTVSASEVGTEITPAEVDDFSTVTAYSVPSREKAKIQKQLHELGEKCAHMSDANCGSCLSDRKYLCLRSLLARFLKKHLLQAHKGIELSDLQGDISLNEEAARVCVFAKVARGAATLTLRNDAGAVLFSQICAQIDKTTFGVVGVLSPSVISEDLRERIKFLAGLVGKRVVFVDSDLLSKMLLHFEEQMKFDEQDPHVIYRASARKKVNPT